MSHANYWENVPYTDLVNDFFAAKPKDVDGVANASALYYSEYLLKKVFAIFDFTIPDTWSLDYMVRNVGSLLVILAIVSFLFFSYCFFNLTLFVFSYLFFYFFFSFFLISRLNFFT